MIGGGLFSRYYLDDGVRQGAAWTALPDAEVEAFAAAARGFLAKVPAAGKLGEAETETLLIFPTLAVLGWSHLPQQKGATRSIASANSHRGTCGPTPPETRQAATAAALSER